MTKLTLYTNKYDETKFEKDRCSFEGRRRLHLKISDKITVK